MKAGRLVDYLDHMVRAASDASVFVEGLEKPDFLDDRRTQQAVVMSLVIIGEAATKVMDSHPEFTLAHPEIPWRSMRGMRNRIAHGYFEINLEVVWETVKTSLPELSTQISAARQSIAASKPD